MFKRTKFIFGVNGALSKMGVNPNQFNPEYRNFMQDLGMKGGNTPQEVAVFMAGQLSMGALELTFEQTCRPILSTWIEQGKIRDEVIQSFYTDDSFGSSGSVMGNLMERFIPRDYSFDPDDI